MAFMDQFNKPVQGTRLKAQMAQLRSMLQGDSSAMMANLMQTNPQFAQFVQQNQGKSPQEAFEAYGYDFSQVMDILNS